MESPFVPSCLEPHIHENGEADKRKLFLKPENQQPIGAHSNCAGHTTRLHLFLRRNAKHGVITYSSGNHAQGVAYAARAMGVKCVVVMPNNVPATKREATKALGAEIVVVGPGSKETATQSRGTGSAAWLRDHSTL